jgi:hypothetical protein
METWPIWDLPQFWWTVLYSTRNTVCLRDSPLRQGGSPVLLRDLFSWPPTDGKKLRDFYHLWQLHEFSFTTAGKKNVKNCRCIVPNFINVYFILIPTDSHLSSSPRLLFWHWRKVNKGCSVLHGARDFLWPEKQFLLYYETIDRELKRSFIRYKVSVYEWDLKLEETEASHTRWSYQIHSNQIHLNM